MIQSLALVSSHRPAAVSAGWLATADPLEWLREAAHCLRQGCPVALYPVARSAADPRAAGVFLVPRQGLPAFRPRVQLLAEVLPGVHAPRDAALSAGLLANEREYFFPYAIHFFHPTLGLTGFDPKDELRPAKLLALPPERGARWNQAVPVDRHDPVLRSIIITEPPGPDEMLEEAGSEIGDQSHKPAAGSGLADKAGLLGKGLAGGAMLGLGWAFQALGKVADFLSGPGVIGVPPEQQGQYRDARSYGPPPGSNKLRQWAEKQWQQFIDKRNRELDRLMKLMETNPDEGLRYALPLTGTGESRGVAPPGWKLGAHDTRFSMGRGGGAIDGWDLNSETQLKLERQYREAARREIALGRHERAAYIFGNLLGDWASAAKALTDGKRYRDAVAIYLHKLNNRPAAARALEEGGMLIQAAGMYAECKQFEKAGDLHAQLGNDTMAREMWQAEVEAQRDVFVKARILNQKLKDPAAALALLDTAWRSSDRPAKALEAMFEIHHEGKDLPASRTLMDAMFSEEVAALSLHEKLKLGDRLRERWQDPLLSAHFEDVAFRKIAPVLEVNPNGAQQLLDFLPRLAPQDRLLARDARRFLFHKAPPKVIHIGPPKGELKPEQVIALAQDIAWHSLATLPKGLSIAGYGKGMLAVAQLRDNGCHSSALRTSDDPGSSFVDHIVARSARGSSRLFHFVEHHCLHYRSLDRLRTSEDEAIGTLRQVLAVSPYGSEGDFAALVYTETSTLSVHIYSEAAHLKRTVSIDLAPPMVAGMRWRMAGSGGSLCFSAGNFLAWRYASGQFAQINLADEATGLELSPASNQVLLTNPQEVLLVEIPPPGKQLEAINLHAAYQAVACFLPDCSVVVAWQGGGVIYPPGNRSKASATFSYSSAEGRPVAVSPRGTGGFAILTDQGKLVVFARA